MSDDLLNQHAAISDLQQTEELVVDQHKAMNEFLAQFLPESQKLHMTTNYVEYDQDSNCKKIIYYIKLFKSWYFRFYSVL